MAAADLGTVPDTIRPLVEHLAAQTGTTGTYDLAEIAAAVRDIADDRGLAVTQLPRRELVSIVRAYVG